MADIDRRELLSRATQLAAGAFGCSLGGLFPTAVQGAVHKCDAASCEAHRKCARPGRPSTGASPVVDREVDFYEKLSDRRVQCFVCPLHCELESGETCFCLTRSNYKGTLYTDAYSNPCIVTTDAIEKLPLNHFLPGTKTLTIACGGCNMRCTYCQNWEQAHTEPTKQKTLELTPQQAVDSAVKRGIPTIAFSYTDPVAFLEYAKDVAILARKRGLRVVAATGAFIDPEPLLDIAQYVDGFAIALKAFDDELYHHMTGARLEPIKTAIRTVKKKTKSWLELVYLVVPTYNDDIPSITRMCRWIRSDVGTDVPLHFARFVPMYKLQTLPQTSVRKLEAAVATARKTGLKCVYTSNIAPHKDTDTHCIKCGTSLIQRLGFKILEDRTRIGRCSKCRALQPGVWT